MNYKSFLDSYEEVVSVEEDVNWLKRGSNPELDFEKPINSWILEGDQLVSLENETNFCDPELIKQVLGLKDLLSPLKVTELSRARSRSNPFESIKGGIFQNRAAMKMANIDAVFDFVFTNPKTETGGPAVKADDVLYFADVCGGPGGFSEYILWRKKWEAKGFGFTLKRSCNFCLDDFLVAPSECLDLHYGAAGIHGDGDIYNSRNITEFAKYVDSQTGGLGVHVMVADGGFSVDGNENLQEVLSKQIYLCQCLMSLCIVREGGHFLCKLFDLYTHFSAGLVYLMYNCFKQVSIHKPNTSRPANSERYLVCKWKKGDTSDVRDFLFAANQRFNILKETDTTKDIVEIVPWHILKTDTRFLEYFIQSNNSLCQRQIYALAKIAAYCDDSNLLEHRQKELRQQCLQFWNVPDKTRNVLPCVVSPEEEISIMLTDNSILYQRLNNLTTVDVLTETVESPNDWMCFMTGLQYETTMRTFFLGLGRREVFHWDIVKSSWRKLPRILELPRYTLLYGEFLTQDDNSVDSKNTPISTLYVIDALYVGGLNVSYFASPERRRQVSRLAKSVNKPSRRDLAQITLMPQFPLDVAEGIIRRYFCSSDSSFREKDWLHQEDLLFKPNGVIMYKSSSKATLTIRETSKKAALPASNFFDRLKSQIGWWHTTIDTHQHSQDGTFVSLADLLSFLDTLKDKESVC